MNERPQQTEAEQRAALDQVSISLEKEAGQTSFRRSIEASSPQAVLNGMAILTVEVAKLLNVSVAKMISLLTVILLAPAVKESEEHGESQ